MQKRPSGLLRQSGSGSGSGSRRRSLLDQMQLVAEEQQSEDLSRSFHTIGRDDDFGGSGRDVHSDTDEEDDMNMAEVIEMIHRDERPDSETIYEGDGIEIVDDGDEGLRAAAAQLDPLYEEEESDDGRDASVTDSDANYLFGEESENQASISTMTSAAEVMYGYGPGPEFPPGGYTQRASFKALRQSIHSNDSSAGHASNSSLTGMPISTLEEEPELGGLAERTGKKRRSNRHRQSIYDTASSETASNEMCGRDSPSSARDHSRRPIRAVLSRQGMFTSRRSSRRSSNRSSFAAESSNSGSGTSNTMDIATAVDRLGSSAGEDGQVNWEHTIAAAAIVAASTNAPGNKRKTKQYSSGEHVLVLLNLLNLQNRTCDPQDFTVCPVNELGYPEGVGRSEKQKQGPFNYLICTVVVVHFDEDERYYTVRRGDTGAEQRADPSVMNPISDENAINIAFKAAKRTRKSETEMSSHALQPQGGPFQQFLSSIKQWPLAFYKNKMVPFYSRMRARVKVQVAHILFGDTGYSFKIQLTGINFLVLCSFFYLFNDAFTLSYLSPAYDYESAVVGLVAWIILLLELLFEGLIRPDNYRQLISSDKAYSPSTARNISTFHLCFESASLCLFLPQFPCIVNKDRCGDDTFFSGVYASMLALTGNKFYERLFGRIILGLTFLKVFALVRHWKQMWVNSLLETDGSNSKVVRQILLLGTEGSRRKEIRRNKKEKDEDASVEDDDDEGAHSSPSTKRGGEDQDLKNAANIGTALMIVNSHRVLLVLLVISVGFPFLIAILNGNVVNEEMAELLAENNLYSNSTEDCDYLYLASKSWLLAQSSSQNDQNYLLDAQVPMNLIWAQLLPVRCDWQTEDGVITNCTIFGIEQSSPSCNVWAQNPGPDLASEQYFAGLLNVRVGELQTYQVTDVADFESSNGSLVEGVTYFVRSISDSSGTVQSTFRTMFLLEISLLIVVLVGLTVMRGDADRLVLDPLQRMLKIVVQYAENPLSHSLSGKKADPKPRDGHKSSAEQLGSYETVQLINAIAKIADLLRKCWGVAGAGIISSNLARTKDGKTVVFNPTVPGKRVYALFGFVAIREFDRLLRALERDVMVLINDVARVVHDEVYRWALGDSGQCNKNLGAAFLMVFRIGDFTEVHDRKKRATDVVFNSNLKSRAAKVKKRRSNSTNAVRASARSAKFELGSNGTLQLASLPGIQSFTDRALLGLLKSYAGLLRDEKMVTWKNDFRLGAGVGAFSVSVIYGMDAGWAVEGAVGSEYKIDATYLSPHVNMASRMMSAAKQYGVTILLSQAVEELLSKPAQSKLRHLDTVIVKGSSRPQRIFTFDARSEGTNFFLFDRPGDQADLDAEMYNPSIWDTDQDLKAMRQHVNEPFMKKFKKGVDLYLSGEWESAIMILKEADNLMIETVIEEGYIESDVSEYGDEIFDPNSTDEEVVRLRNHFGDGACKNLINYMKRRNAKPPADWRGYRALMSK